MEKKTQSVNTQIDTTQLNSAGAKPALRLEAVSKSFGDSQVLKEISLELMPGEVMCVIGPSGGGKSTLLRCSTMLDRFDQGSLLYGSDFVCQAEGADRKAQYKSPAELRRLRQKIGLVFQDFNLFDHWTALKNIADPLITVKKWPKKEALARAEELLARMDLSDRAAHYPHQLSGGQKQRVAIARALALEPETLFFDEPTSALDPELTQEILRVMRSLAEENMTMLVVTHEIDFARSVADRVVFMSDGVIVEQGRAQDLIDNPQHSRTKAFLSRVTLGEGR